MGYELTICSHRVTGKIDMNCVYCKTSEAHWAYKPLCLTCHHWLEVVVKQQELVITDGQAYSIGKDTDNPRGFGGVEWRVAFHSGARISTRSLWHLGRIPARFAPLLLENATLEQVQHYTSAIPEMAGDLIF
jgi:hypothetical protein